MDEFDARGDGFNRALVAERLTSVAVLATPQKLLEFLPLAGTDLSDETRNRVMARVQKAKTLKDEQAYYEETFQQLMSIRKMPLPDRLKAGEFIRQRVAKAVARKLAVIEWLLPGLAGQ